MLKKIDNIDMIKKTKKVLKGENDVEIVKDNVVKNEELKQDDTYNKKESNAKKSRAKQKAVIFEKERTKILEKFNKILGIEGMKGFFCINDMSDEQSNAILNEAGDIKKYYSYGTWSYFKDPNMDKAHISLIKNIYKEHGYIIRQTSSYRTVKGEKTSMSTIFVEKKND